MDPSLLSVPFRCEDAAPHDGILPNTLHEALDRYQPRTGMEHLLVALDVLMQESGFLSLDRTDRIPDVFSYVLADAEQDKEAEVDGKVTLKAYTAGPKVVIVGKQMFLKIAL